MCLMRKTERESEREREFDLDACRVNGIKSRKENQTKIYIHNR